MQAKMKSFAVDATAPETRSEGPLESLVLRANGVRSDALPVCVSKETRARPSLSPIGLSAVAGAGAEAGGGGISASTHPTSVCGAPPEASSPGERPAISRKPQPQYLIKS